MEDFYNNPFDNQEEEDAICYADIVPPHNSEPSVPLGTDDNANVAEGTDRTLSLSYALRFQSQLSEAMRANASLRATYEAHINTQRQEIDKLGTENSKLMSKLTGVESQLRSMILEKECAAMAHKHEVEKNIALEEKIASLEAELNSVERRTKDLAATYCRTPRHKPQHAQKHFQPTPTHSNEHLLQTPKSKQYKLDNSFEEHSSGTTQRTSAPWSGEKTHPDHGQQSQHNTSSGFEMRSNKTVDQRTVQQLEKELMHQCLEKDEIERQLQKIENMRLRTVMERSRKMTLERELEAAQKKVMDLRRRLRLVSSRIQ